MASVKLKLKTSQKLSDGSHPIIIQILKDNKKAITTLGISCFYDKWNTSSNLPKNRRLSIICQKKLLEIEEILFEGEDKDWSVKKIVNIFNGKDTKHLMFFDYVADLKFDNKGISSNLLNKTKLNKFRAFLRGNDIAFQDITFKLLKDYRDNLKEEGLKSVSRYLAAIRQLYNFAIENDDFIPTKNPFKSSLFEKKITRSTTNRNLNKNQITKLFSLKYGNEWKPSYKDIALDFWKFCFFNEGY